MVDEVQSSDLEDPLKDYSALYCISRTFRDLPGGPNSIDTNDLESIHSYFKTMALKNPNQLLHQAKAILDSGSELPNSEFPIGNEFLAEKDKENNPQERRLGLGRKKVLFSMKDYSSQPAPSLDLTLDVDKLGNPEEYFLAFEKREAVKKEYEIHGVLPDSHQDTITSKTSRHHRAGLLGRPSKYKHRFSMLSEINQALASSEEPFAQNILSPSNHNSQQDISDSNIASQEMELAGPVTEKEKLNEILDQFLSSQDLAGDGAISFMQERLHIKPIEVDKLSLPVVHDIRRDSFKASGGNLPKHRSSIPDLSLLNKHILQSKPLHDTFPDPNTEPSPARSSFLAGAIDKQSDQVDMGKELRISGKLDPPIFDENDTVVANTDLREVITEDSTSPFTGLLNGDVAEPSPARSSFLEGGIDKQSDQVDTGKELSISAKLDPPKFDENNSVVANTVLREVITEDSTSPFNKPVNANLSRPDVDIDVHSSGSHGNVEDINGGHNRDDNSSRLDTDVSIPATIKHLAMDEPSRTPDIDPEHDVEIKEPLRHEESKERRLSSQKVKKLSRKNEQSEERTILGQKINEQIPESTRPRKGRKRNAHTPSQTLAIANIEDSTPFRKLVFDNLSRLDVDIDVHSIGSHGNVEDIIGESTMDDNSRRPDTDASSPTTIKHHAIHEPSGTPNVAPEHDVEEIQEPLRNVESKERGLSTQKARKGSRKSEQSKDRTTPDVSGPATIKHLAMDEPSGTPNISPEHDVEIQEPSRNEESKERRISSQKVKKSSRKNEQSKEKTIRGQEVNEQSPASKRPLRGHKRNVLLVANNLSRLDVDIYVHSIGSHGIVEDTNGDSTMGDNSRRPETDASSPATIKHHVIDESSGTPNVAPEHDVEEIQEPSRKSEQSKDRTTPGQEVNEHSQANKRPRKSDQSKERTIPGQEVNEQRQANKRLRKSIQSKERTIPDQEVNGQSRAKERRGRKRNVHNLTQTLADAGTHWESGLRKSTRIRSKPLKYWKGERFLYGRVDENLVTVIGMKYASPTMGDKTPALKVKSYVSEKYKALVELAAMH